MGPVLGAEGQGWACPVCVQNPIRCPQSPGAAGRVLSAEVGVQTLTGAALSLSPRGPPWQQALSSCWVPGKGPQPLQLQGTGEGRAGRGSCVYQNYSPCLSSLTQGWRGVGPKVRGNGAALFDMFSYLIPCPRKGPSLTLLGWPHGPPAHPALLGQPKFPTAAATRHLDQLRFLSVLLPPEPAPFSLPSPLLSYLFCTCGLGL